MGGWCKPIFLSNPQPSCFGLLLSWVAVAWLGFGVMTIVTYSYSQLSLVTTCQKIASFRDCSASCSCYSIKPRYYWLIDFYNFCICFLFILTIILTQIITDRWGHHKHWIYILNITQHQLEQLLMPIEFLVGGSQVAQIVKIVSRPIIMSNHQLS